MKKKIETALDYRLMADKIWEMARSEEELGHFELASYLKEMADSMHSFARKKEEIEQFKKNAN